MEPARRGKPAERYRGAMEDAGLSYREAIVIEMHLSLHDAGVVTRANNGSGGNGLSDRSSFGVRFHPQMIGP